VVLDWPKRTSFRVALPGGEPFPIYQDSTIAVPIRNGEYLLFWDHRSGRRGFYTISMADVRAKRHDAAKKVANYEVSFWSMQQAAILCCYMNNLAKSGKSRCLMGNEIGSAGPLPIQISSLAQYVSVMTARRQFMPRNEQVGNWC